MSSLPGLFSAVTAGTFLLLLTVYGLLVRLVLRPLDDLVGAERAFRRALELNPGDASVRQNLERARRQQRGG